MTLLVCDAIYTSEGTLRQGQTVRTYQTGCEQKLGSLGGKSQFYGVQTSHKSVRLAVITEA